MASEYIPIDTTVAGGKASALANALAAGRTFRDGLQNVKMQMEKMIDAGSYAEVETRFGLPTGKGEATYNLVTGTLADMEAADNIGQLLARLG